ncbi:lectin receptor kinase [Lasius niger]|uniref:Lectin receptor kinase n=1 Tax=Lasius niger TaxID=67767 RepID=A0A0J7K416_LASNI|nr:lectin receptor kinase [Lasius niger]
MCNSNLYFEPDANKARPGSTPFEFWTGKKAKISHLRKIGSVAFNHVPAVQRTKWQPKSKKMILVGYDEEIDNYRLMDPKTKKVVISTNVMFHEKSNCELEESSDENTTAPIIETENDQQASEDDEDQQYESKSDVLSESKVKTPRENIQRQLRDRNKLKAPKRLEMNLVEKGEPVSYEEAIKGPEGEKWKEAINEELDAMEKNSTWTVVKNLPKGRRPISAKWIFKKKLDEEGNVVRYKARLVARGYSQREGIDYEETFAPVVRYETVRTLLAEAAMNKYEIGQFDVKTAFLNGDLEEEIFMELPEGTAVPKQIVRLHKSLYGLKQSPRQWNKRFDEFLRRFHFENN